MVRNVFANWWESWLQRSFQRRISNAFVELMEETLNFEIIDANGLPIWEPKDRLPFMGKLGRKRKSAESLKQRVQLLG